MTISADALPRPTSHHRLVVIVMTLVGALAAANWIVNPDRAWHWLRGMVSLPLCWAALTLCGHWMLRSRARRGLDDSQAVRAYFGQVASFMFVTAGLFHAVRLGLELWVWLTHPPTLETPNRLLGLAIGAFLVVLGNGLPKILTPLSMLPPGGAARQTAARRFIGFMWVVCGLTAAGAFVLAPLDFARQVRTWALVTCGVAMLVGIVWMNSGPSHQEEYR